jgi:FkbH-like protein
MLGGNWGWLQLRGNLLGDMMTEDRLREILATILGIPPESISDATSVETVNGFDSLTVMSLVMAVEEHVDYQFTDDEIATLTSWPNIKAVVRAHETGTSAPFYKALVLDADGTLWGGIAAEGGAQVSGVFLEAQAIYLGMGDRGVILAIATKNEPGEVEAVLNGPEGFLEVDDFTFIQAGWGNKVFGLKAIAKHLNIGLDAIVFVDDSPFECGYVRSHLPEVKVVQVPQNLAEYPRVAQEIADLFPVLVDVAKTDEYRALAAAERTRPQFETEEEYLSSLGIEVEIHCNRSDEIPRIAELTQKANQFNLTTHRFTESQIKAQIVLHSDVYSLSYRDKFGDQGLVGVIILIGHEVDTFLLSCRVLGRGVEFAPWEFLDLGEVRAEYAPTAKNGQVEGFWRSVKLLPYASDKYEGRINSSCPSWIKVTRV